MLATADEGEDTGLLGRNVPEIARRLLRGGTTLRSLDRLRRAGYIEASISWAGPQRDFQYLGITIEGLRDSEMWPKRQLDAADLLALVKELGERSSPEQRDRWEQVRPGLLAGGMGALGEFAAAVGLRATRLGW